jgi:transcriptional regulator with XRE-family HTH domain
MSSFRNNYLRPHRKQIGFSQSEVAFLLGFDQDGQVSRYEKGEIIPPLRTALALATIFDTSVSTLFSEMQYAVDRNILSRMKQLCAHLEEGYNERDGTAGNNYKLRSLKDRLSRFNKRVDSEI